MIEKEYNDWKILWSFKNIVRSIVNETKNENGNENKNENGNENENIQFHTLRVVW